MAQLIQQAFYLFFKIMEYCLVAYLILSWIPFGKRIKRVLELFLDPLLTFVQYLLKHSIFGSNVFDMSPLISLLIVTYAQLLLSSPFDWSTL